MITLVTDTSEKAFQNDIIAHLVSTGHKKRGIQNYNKKSQSQQSSHSVRELLDSNSCGVQEMKELLHFCT